MEMLPSMIRLVQQGSGVIRCSLRSSQLISHNKLWTNQSFVSVRVGKVYAVGPWSFFKWLYWLYGQMNIYLYVIPCSSNPARSLCLHHLSRTPVKQKAIWLYKERNKAWDCKLCIYVRDTKERLLVRPEVCVWYDSGKQISQVLRS